jgi:hypothetical protein
MKDRTYLGYESRYWKNGRWDKWVFDYEWEWKTRKEADADLKEWRANSHIISNPNVQYRLLEITQTFKVVAE